MLLAIDIGNTNVVIGVWDGPRLARRLRVSTSLGTTADELGALIRPLLRDDQRRPLPIDAAIASSVVPPLTRPVVEMTAASFDVRCLVVGPGVRTGMPILYEDPAAVGPDRVVNAVAARSRWSGGLIIIDMGTATTFDVVTPKGEYLGGAICPGIGISSEALFRHASRLPRVELSRPRAAVGRNNPAAIRSGLILGYVGLVEGLVARMRAEAGFDCAVVATGGLAPLVSRETSAVDHLAPDLTLEGLRVIHELNARDVSEHRGPGAGGVRRSR
ncbi:MAG: type III pantothenate kinase [Myxococcales bacterium]|nr:type III pantothenate kinase [Myxococcales bacterium]